MLKNPFPPLIPQTAFPEASGLLVLFQDKMNEEKGEMDWIILNVRVYKSHASISPVL